VSDVSICRLLLRAVNGRGCVKTFFSAIGAQCWTENRVSTQNLDRLSNR